MLKFSEFLWSPRESQPSLPSSNQAADNVEHRSDLSWVPVERAGIEPECRLVVSTEPRSPGADRFRYMKMRLRELKELAKLRSFAITSPLPQDGKSTVSLNLATVLAEEGRRTVLVVEADMHHPTFAQRLGVKRQPGLSECLESGLDPLMAVRRIAPPQWYLLQAGTPIGNPTELLQSGCFASVLQRLSPYFDWILIDTPPVCPLTDALSVARHVDGSLLVVRANQTPRDAVEEAISLLGPKQLLGIVFNAADELNQQYSKYHGYYLKK